MGVEIICAFCGRQAQGNFSVHRDGWGEGPEVELCDGCGGEVTPTLDEIWARLAEHRESTPSSSRPAKVARRRQLA